MAENGGAPVAYLCSDMIYEILLRVPAVYIHRSCRNVCQAWRQLLGERPFIAAYGRRRSPMPLYFYHEVGVPYGYHGNPGDFLYSDDLDAVDLAAVDLAAVDLAARDNHRVLGFADTAVDFWNNDLDDDEPVSFRIRGSCDGVLFLDDLQLDRLYACNPCTRHWARLPECPFVAFYAHGPLGEGREYRVLQAHPGEAQGDHPTTIYSIRVLGAPEQLAVRLIGRPTSPAMSAESALALDGVLSRGIGAHLQGPPVMLHGSLHWLPTYNGSDRHGYKLVAFDTVAEDFRWISPPPALTDPYVTGDTDEVYGIIPFQLLEIDGKLAMAIMDVRPGTMVIVWVLDDYVREEWIQMHEIDLLPLQARVENHYDLDRMPPLYVASVNRSQELHALIPCPGSLLQCDASGALLQYHWRPGHAIFCTGHSIEEGFVRPPFLSWQGNDAIQPSFVFQNEIFQ